MTGPISNTGSGYSPSIGHEGVNRSKLVEDNEVNVYREFVAELPKLKDVQAKQENKPSTPSWLAGMAPTKWAASLAGKIKDHGGISRHSVRALHVGGNVLAFVTLPLWLVGAAVGTVGGGLVGALIGSVLKVAQMLDKSKSKRTEAEVSIADYRERGSKETAYLTTCLGSVGGCFLVDLANALKPGEVAPMSDVDVEKRT